MDTLIQPQLAHSHPLAGATMSGADIIIQVLADEGVDTIFGYSGGAILPTYDAVFRYNQANSRERRRADAVDRACQRARRRLHGRGLRSRQRPRRRRHGDLGPGRYELRDARARLHGRFDPDRRDLRPSPDRRDRQRRVPGSAGRRHHGVRGQARVPRHGPVAPRGHDAHGVRDRAHGPAGARRRRRAEGRAELARHVRRRESAADPGLPTAARRRRGQRALGRELPAILLDARRKPAAIDLRRRRRHQRQREQRAARVLGLFQDSRRQHADGARRFRHEASAVAAHARHARHGERELRRRRLRSLDLDRRALRRSRRGSAGQVRAERETRPALRHRSVRDPQGQEGGLASRRPAAARRSMRWSHSAAARGLPRTSMRGTRRSRRSRPRMA